MINILILGSGGREHAIAWKIKQSPLCGELYIGPGNGGTGQLGTNVSLNINNFAEVKSVIEKYSIGMVIIGPEEPLVRGLVDQIKTDQSLGNIRVIGPSATGAKLEGSKEYAKNFMEKYGIPTGKAKIFNQKSLEEGLAFLDTFQGPYVLKADGLAAGKGVIITSDVKEAKANLSELIGGRFGQASSRVLIEEFLDGIELSVFVLTDGKSYTLLPSAKDYKRIGEGDTGPNTGGMGAVSPVVFADDVFMEKVTQRIIKPTIEGIRQEGFDYCGFVFFGLIKVGDDPYVIEYNVRMGDPETEAVMPRISSDLVAALLAASEGRLAPNDISFSDETCATVVMVSGGYPGDYEKGHTIRIDETDANAFVFHAGTLQSSGKLKSNGGRVLAVTGQGSTLEGALKAAYQSVAGVTWSGHVYRKDIGRDLQRLGQL